MSRFTVEAIEGEFHRYKTLGEGALGQLGSDELVAMPEAGNSIATLVWHISGNLESRFTDFLTTDGEKPGRDRDGELASRVASAEEIRAKWERGWEVLFRAIEPLDDADLARGVAIRGVPLRVDEALARALAHISYHVGQVVYAARLFRGNAWRYLSIPPGGSAAYNAAPTMEKPGKR
jgi:hypothetical protein